MNKFGCGSGDGNMASWKNWAKGLGEENVPSCKIGMKARITKMIHHECTKLLEETHNQNIPSMSHGWKSTGTEYENI